MCGIAGFLNGPTRTDGADALSGLAQQMAATLRHRGPDASGVWVDAADGIAFGHTRLAIVDLSEAGAQPMVSSCGRCVIAYNGEVYNAAELRGELMQAGRTFRGHSDTEVIVEGCAEWGVRRTVERCIGMFALALWDTSNRTLTLVRDRLGIKPLYWGEVGGRFAFASELKALQALPGWRGEIDRQALAEYLTRSYVPAPRCIYKGLRKLEPGTWLEVAVGGSTTTGSFWSLSQIAARGQREPLDLSDAEATAQLEDLLADATRRRMIADVPLGAFLSGGVDSSTVVALMQAGSERPVRSFSIGFHEQDYNEAREAKAVAQHLGTDHTELYATAQQVRDVIPKLPTIYDEPFADSSQVPTFLVSEMTRAHVTVALSGDGGDELFAGYNRYAQGLAMARAARMLPARLRAALASGVLALPPRLWDNVFRAVPAARRPRLAGDKMHKLAGVIGEDEAGFYRKLTSQYDQAWALVPGAAEPQIPHADPSSRAALGDQVAWMQYLDTRTYLPDDILTKVDRASMAVSLEVRVPVLDHRVVEFAWRLPKRFKIRDGTSKWLLRQVLYRHVPKELIERPKMGFGIPLDDWLRGPLRGWAEALLAPDALAAGGLLNPEPILAKWAEHQSGTRNWQYLLWNVLMFQAWRKGAA